MTGFDRDQARDILTRYAYYGDGTSSVDGVLDRLAACWTDDLRELTVEVQEFTPAAEKLARIAAICDSPDEILGTGQEVVFVSRVLDVLHGGATS